jgi:hypothetical protein
MESAMVNDEQPPVTHWVFSAVNAYISKGTYPVCYPKSLGAKDGLKVEPLNCSFADAARFPALNPSS